MQNKKHIFSLIFILFILTVFAQKKTKNFKLEWKNNSEFNVISTTKSGTIIKLPNVKNGSFDEFYLPTYSNSWKVERSLQVKSYKIKNIVYETISKDLFKKESQKKFPKKIKSSFEIKNARDKSFAVMNVTPLLLVNGILKKINSFEIEYILIPKINKKNSSTIHDSPLANGNWYKFAIDTTGVYKLSKGFINSLGLNTDGVNPKNIKIYGNGGAMLNEINGDFRYDGLQENAIYVEGEEDGNFDSNDFVLFYAEGPDVWKHDVSNNKASHQTNIYSDQAFYFITINDGFGKRIQSQTNVENVADLIVTTSNDFRLHEVDSFNFDSFGQEFYGESFQTNDTQNFTFNFTDLDLALPIDVKLKAAATENSQFNLNIDGQNIVSLNTGSLGNTDIGATSSSTGNFITTNEIITTEIVVSNNLPSTKVYLDYIEINGLKKLIARDIQFSFRNYQAANHIGIVKYEIQNNQNIFQIWNVSDKINPKIINNQATNSNFTFKTFGGSLNEYILLNENDYYLPTRIQTSLVPNQNLHAIQDIDYLIITPDEIRGEAQRLADYHSENSGFSTLVLNPEIIYNEFSSGAQDITAIRDFVNHLYSNASSDEKRIKYVLLFGDTSFDFKNIEGNNGLINVIAFQSVDSFDTARSYVSDDYFGMLDDNEGNFSANNGSGDKQDVATGRMPVKNLAEAKSAIDRTLSYYKKEAFGKWRNQITMVADDVDNEGFNFTLQKTMDSIAKNITINKPVYDLKKIYADAFVQEINAGGQRYPTVKLGITNAIERGTLLLNYFGHGGENGWASERFLDVPQVQGWYNENTLPLFITITCEFSRLDNPNRNTAGEFLFSNTNGGSVAMLTTTRAVFISFGKDFNIGLTSNLLEFNQQDNLSMAQVLMKTKNNTNNTQRLFIYFFGDPAMKLPIAKPDIKITEMNGEPIANQLDTIKALSHVYFKGIISSNLASNTPNTNFNGELFASIFDKSIVRTTLNNDNYDGNPNTIDFDVRESKIFNGRASVVNGEWEFDFIAPRDIRIAYGNAKLSFYAHNEEIDRSGYSTDIIIGGINSDALEDDIGPTIKLFMNDESFVDGGNTNESPLFIAVLEDNSGINTSLTAVDHDIIAILDGDTSNPIIMNDFYETELNDFTKGKVNFPFRDLEVGLHTLSFKCWDTYNNSSEATLNFVVVSDQNLVLDNVLNYPNPFINYTEFWFNHNKPNETLETQVQIFTVSGKLIKTINRTVNTGGLINGSLITWNGLDDFGNKIGKGVYIYKLNVKVLSNGLKSEKFEKLVILQ